MSVLLALTLLATGAAPESAPQATPEAPRTAKAAKAGVGLEFSLLKNHVRMGDPLFVKLRLTNRSKHKLSVFAWIFRGSDNIPKEWTEGSAFHTAPYIEVRAPDGEILHPLDDVYDVSPGEERLGPVIQDSRISSWTAAGISQEEINRRLEAEDTAVAAARREKKYPPIELLTGQSATTASWCAERSLNLSGTILCPGNGFVELNFAFDKPGRYRARIVYDQRIPKGLREEEARHGLHIPDDEWQIRVATEWIDFQVLK
jgi:hypothetical protein